MILSNSFVGTVVGFNTPGLLQQHSLTKSYQQQNGMKTSNILTTMRSKTKKTALMAMMAPKDILDSASSLIQHFHGHEIPIPSPVNSQHHIDSVESSLKALLSTMYSSGVTVPDDLASLLESGRSIPPAPFDGEFVNKAPEMAQEAISKGKDIIDGADVGKLDAAWSLMEKESFESSTLDTKNLFDQLALVTFLFVALDFFVISSAERDLFKEDIEEYGADVLADSVEGIVVRGIALLSIVFLVEYFS